MDWPLDIQPYRCDFYLQNRSTVFNSPMTGTRQVLAHQGARWICTASFRFVGINRDHRRLAQRVDALLGKLKGQLETVNVWDFARPEPLGPNLDRTSIPVTYFVDPGIRTFTDGTGFSGGAAGRRAYGSRAIGATSVVVDGFPADTTQLYAGDYVGFGDRLYMLTEDADANSSGRATLSLNRGLLTAVTHGDIPTFVRPSTPMQLVDDDQPNRSVGLSQVYEFSASFVEALF